jgi:tetratricopeptide (TPR) repeat protein
VYFRTGRLNQAVELLERAVELEPNDAVINDHLGDAYWVVGRRIEARYQWRRALRAIEDDPDLADAIHDKLENGLTDPAFVVEPAAAEGGPAGPGPAAEPTVESRGSGNPDPAAEGAPL